MVTEQRTVLKELGEKIDEERERLELEKKQGEIEATAKEEQLKLMKLHFGKYLGHI